MLGKLFVLSVDDIHSNYVFNEHKSIDQSINANRNQIYQKRKEDADKNNEDDNGPYLKQYDIPLDY